jgi:hypothetical protein
MASITTHKPTIHVFTAVKTSDVTGSPNTSFVTDAIVMCTRVAKMLLLKHISFKLRFILTN